VKIINLISGPRNISTALMYSFAQRNDTTVFDEPFYAIYLSETGAQHPGRNEVLNAQSTDESEIKAGIAASKEPVAFVKNMAHHMEVLDEPFISDAINVFLIRNPHQIIASYSKVIDKPVMRDIGIEYQFKLFSKLKDKAKPIVVIDSGLLLQNPEAVLKLLSHACSIGFQPAMLTWAEGPKPYDGVWASYWYNNVHRSTGFEKQDTSSRPLREDLKPLYEEARFYYEKLLPFSLKA
jgi:hypothetical protein